MIRRLFGSLQAARFLERKGLPDRSANNSNDDTLWRESLREMARHFPPSGAELRLLDIGGDEKQSAHLSQLRPDLNITQIGFSQNSPLAYADNSFDAVMLHEQTNTGSFLREVLRVLRPGGRLISFISDLQQLESAVQELVAVGFARVLAENILNGYCTLIRGEKPYTQQSTIERIAQTSARDESADGGQLISPEMLESASKGKFVFLLVRQSPDKPAWALSPDELIRWRAVMVNGQEGQSYLLAFTSLNKAVEFMQAAVTNNVIQGINKVAKYPKSTVRDYATDLLLNPPFDVVREQYPYTGIMLDVDPQRAVTGEE